MLNQPETPPSTFDRTTLKFPAAPSAPQSLKPRQALGKYRIRRKLADSHFATVYEADDTIEGIAVALKIPHSQLMSKHLLETFRREVRLAARLDHPNILPLKNAAFVDGHFVIAFPLGQQTLADRLCYRLSFRTALDFAGQMLEAVAYAHGERIMHCDIKPENVILFPGNRLRLTDFGIARVAQRTIQASGSGTIGYIAPEQAMGRPSFRSDVFSLGLVIYRMFSGHWPQWPFRWPPPGFARIRQRLHPDLTQLLRKALEVNPRLRYENAVGMLAAFRRIRPRALQFAQRRSARP
jgi:serine/threonine protein kinase